MAASAGVNAVMTAGCSSADPESNPCEHAADVEVMLNVCGWYLRNAQIEILSPITVLLFFERFCIYKVR